MKKLLIILTFMLTGAFGIIKADSKKIQDKKICNSWVKVTSECGTVFYLCSDNYDNFNDLKNSALYFSDIKCN